MAALGQPQGLPLLPFFPYTLDHGNPLGDQIEEVRRKWRAFFWSRITALGVVGSGIPDLQSIAGRLPREIGRPSQNVATGTLAEPIAAQHQALADFQRLRFESQLEVALHILAEGLHRFLENFPGRLRRLNVPPLMTACAGVKDLVIQRPYFIFNLRRDVLVIHLLQERSRHLLGLARKIGMYLQKTLQDTCSFLRFQALQCATPRALSCCLPLGLTLWLKCHRPPRIRIPQPLSCSAVTEYKPRESRGKDPNGFSGRLRCPELAAGQCKPGGDLRFVLADFPRLGSVCRIHTCSYRSIRQIHSALQEIQTFTGGRLAGITAKLTVRPEEATYFDRRENRKRTGSIWALSLEVERDDMRKLIANLTENARLFAETRKLLGSGGKVFEVVEDDQEQATEIAAEFYPTPANGTVPAEGGEATFCAPRSQPLANGEPHPPADIAEPTLVSDATPSANAPKPAAQPSSSGNGTASAGGNGSAKPPANRTTSLAAHNNGNGSARAFGFNQLRNEFLTVARRVATTKKQAIAVVVEWARGGAFKYGDVGRMTEADVPKLRAATELIASALHGTAR